MLVADRIDEICWWQVWNDVDRCHQHHSDRNWNWVLVFICNEFGDEGYDAYRGGYMQEFSH